MESNTKEVTIDAVRCEEVHFHAETNGDEKNILISFNELVTNFSSNSKQLFTTNGENIKAVISAGDHKRTKFDEDFPISHHLNKSADYESSKVSCNHAKSNKDNGSSNDKLGNTAAPPHFPYRFVRSKKSERTKHKDSRKDPSSSNLKMSMSMAPHLKYSHQNATRKELERSMILNTSMEVQKTAPSNKQKQSTKSRNFDENVGESSSGELNNLEQSTRDAVLKIALESLTDVHKIVQSESIKKNKLSFNEVSHQYTASEPTKKGIDTTPIKNDSNNNGSLRKSSLEQSEKNIFEQNVKVESPCKPYENSENDQSSSCYESIRFEPLPSFCDKTFGQNLTASTELANDDKGYRCKFCNKSFAKERYLKMHQKVHSEERPYKCDICNKTFRWRSNLNEHQHIHNDKPFQCGVCKQEFSQLSDFRNHQLIHSEERPVKCQCCDKSFDDPRHLKVHYQVHSEDRPYKCSVCDKAFRWRSNLTGHMHIHNMNKPYRCEICMQGFTQISNFKNHQLLHSGEKPHKCPECNKTFAQARYLKTHQKLHSEERPYICKHCGKAFRWPGNLRGHLQLHKQDKSYKCDQCGSCFSQYAGLSRHLNHHCSVSKKCDVPSQIFLDNFEIMIQKKQQNKEESGEELDNSDEHEKTFTQTSTRLNQLSKEDYKEIHVVFKQNDELQPRTSEEEN